MEELRGPVLVIGAGGAGSRLARSVSEAAGFGCLQISDDMADLSQDCRKIHIPGHGIINPSSHLLRSHTAMEQVRILDEASEYPSIIIIANLAGKAGSAISPMAARMLKDAGKKVLSFCIMPFGFEKGGIFRSGIALKRLKECSACTIIADNDAVLDSNPDLSRSECLKIIDSAIVCTAGSIGSRSVPDGASIISTSRDLADLEESLRDSLKMLYSAAPDGAGRSILYVLGSENIPAGTLKTVASLSGGVLGEDTGFESGQSAKPKTLMVSVLQEKTRFDAYDPLGVIPSSNTLDWDEPECSIGCALDLRQIE